MHGLIALLFVSICSVQSMQAMLRSMDMLKVAVGSRYISSTSVSALYAYRLDPQDNVDDTQGTRHVSTVYQASDLECSNDDGEVDVLLNKIEDIKRKGAALELSILHGFSSDSRVENLRMQFCKEPFPLVAAVNALNDLDDAITGIIPKMKNIASLENETSFLECDQATIKRTMNVIKRDPQWTEQYVGAATCARLQCD